MVSAPALLSAPPRGVGGVAVPVAACAFAPAWLFARPARATVVGVFSNAVYLLAESPAADLLPVLPVLAPDALRLPGGVNLSTRDGLAALGVELGEVVAVGDGGIETPGARLRVRRRVRPKQVPSANPPAAQRDRALAALDAVLGGEAEPYDTAATAVLAALRGGAESLSERTAALVGLGPGLTPSGDDVLCGLLLGLRATGRGPFADRLGGALAPLLGRTTALSATLLRHAAGGYAVPQVVALLGAAFARTGGRDDLAAPTAAVAAIGGSSGRDLLVGVRAAVSYA